MIAVEGLSGRLQSCIYKSQQCNKKYNSSTCHHYITQRLKQHFINYESIVFLIFYLKVGCFIIHLYQINYKRMQTSSIGISKLVLLAFLIVLANFATVPPTFITTIAGTFETGSAVLTASTTSTSGSFTSQSTTITYANSYTSTPLFGYGFAYINSLWTQTTTAIETIIDVTSSSGANSQIVKLNFTSSTVTLFSINYVVSSSNSFLDIQTYLCDLTATDLSSSSLNSVRSTTINLPFKFKSNSSNSIAIYNTIGLSMMRASNTFEFTLSTLGYSSNTINVYLTVMANNGMKFIRFAIFNYQKIVTIINSPFFIDMAFVSNLGGSIPDSSNLALSTTGTIYMGMTDWALSDSYATILYNMSLSGTTYTLAYNNTVSRTQSVYLWYRQQVCPTYYFNQTNVCVSCDYTCLTCTSSTSTSCSSCDSASFRTLFSSNSSCPCNSNYWDAGARICQKIVCPTTCLSCSSDNVCSSCSSSNYRTLSNGSCVCQSYTIDMNGQSTCQVCYPTCVTCSVMFSSTACSTCSSSRDHRSFNAGTLTCSCINGYYQIPNLSSNWFTYIYIGAPCLPCQYSCATCTINTSCSSCDASLHRTSNSSTGFCSCSSGYYDNNLLQSCFSCPYSCSTCSSSTVCLTCPNTRTLTSNQCPCLTGYYEAGVLLCSACNYTCYTCSGSSSCSSCSTTYFRTMSNNTCICIGGYYDPYNSQSCNPCDSTCLTCSGAGSSACSTCDGTKYRSLTVNKTCVCLLGYYQNSGASLCSSCYYTCESCINGGDCLTCSATNHRILSNSSCICSNKYYDDSGNQLCKSCSYFCLTCTNSSSCLTCDSSTRSISNLATCPCLSGYFDDGISSSCQPCLASCQTCNNANNCSTCVTNRQITALASCSCISRTYQPYCDACAYSCYTCLGTSTTCTSCNGTAMRYFNSTSSQCICYQGYYDAGPSQMCGTCHYSCLTCTNGNSCSTCPVNRVLNGSYCSCLSSYYQNSSNLNCIACHYSCLTCSSYSVCSTCDGSAYRSTSSNTSLCVCNDGYYDNGISQTCFSCYSTCLTCSQYSVCTSCNSTLHYYYSNGTCLCNTGYYFDIPTASCIGCHYSCNSCTSSTSCSTCMANRTLTATYCTCNSGLFDNPSTKTCSSCTYPCITCSGASTTCTSCDSTRNLSVSTCACTGSTYDAGLSCPSCLSTCQTCTNAATCTTCLTGSLRTLNNNLCVCPTGYHDQNGTLLNCKTCNYSCVTCINSLTCSSCYSGRSAVSGGYCACPTYYYYDNGVNGQCVSCAYSCLTCSVISTSCTSCLNSTYRSFVNNTCTCQIGYYDDLSSATCQACHYSCQACSGAGSCSLCNATNLRVYGSGPLCSCMPSYFDVSNVQLCSSCSYTCLTCVTSTTMCLTCASSRTLVNASSSCICNNGYYDGGVSTCYSCMYSCSTCNNGSSCLTCPSTRQLNSFLECQCLTSYYDVVNSTLCSSCSPTCLTCTAYQVCTLCDTSNNFRQLVNTTCQCPAGYYDASSSGNYTCQLCSYSCATCVSSIQCSSCNSNYQRVYSISTSLCACASGYYDNSVNSPCIQCPFDCLTCLNSTFCLTCSSNRYLANNSRCLCLSAFYANGTNCESCPVQCLTCSNSSSCTSCNGNRTLLNSACICPTGLYSVTGTATCSGCQYSCSSCLASTQCSTCNSTLYRYLTSTFCFCMTGYYDDGTNQACKSCYYSCLMCSNGATCLTCSSSNNRVLNSVTLLCDCISGYYQDSTTHTCIKCPYSCLTCSNGLECTSCNTNYNRALNATNQCNCLAIGYFDTFVSAVCSSCSYTCQSCSGSASYCTSCLNTTNRVLSASSCLCSNGYYDVANQAICLTCSYKCVTCSSSSTSCTLCSSSNYRDTTPACSCITGFYDDGANSTCATCNYVCETCSNSLTCSTCNLTLAHRSINNITLLCDCISQYYDNGIQICQPCSYSCTTCSSAVTCLTCPSTRSLTLNQCICQPKYYDDYVSNQCQSCNYTCQTCQNSSSCFSCNSNNMRTFNSSTYICSCLAGYYDTGIQACSKCDSSCLTCTSATACESCPSSINKTLNSSSGSNFCVCLYGYYQNVTAGASLGYNSVCNPCYYACQTCSGQSTYCTLCSNSSNRYLTTSRQCACNVGYFQSSGQQTCFACYTHCLTCTGVNSNNCLTCDNSTYYLSNTCYTSCPSYYNISTTLRTCVSCPTNCLTCPTSLTVCSLCNSPYFLFSYNSSYTVCITSCPSYYYQINSTCYACNSPCLSCSNAYTCTSCINLYYLDNGSCNPCHSLCLTCSGSTALDCLTCVSNYVLKGSVCQKLSCLSTQYVQSISGCVNCTTTFPNSLSCLSTGPTSCLNGYILSNNTCLTCTSVAGYAYDSSSGKCKDYCGDNILITDLCDDGNTLNGDGCSSFCTIETGWTCPNNTCNLISSPTIQVVSTANNANTHTITIILSLSIGLRLVDANFILSFSSITLYSYTTSSLNIYYTQYQLTIVYYQTAQNNYLNIQIKSPISRLLSQNRYLATTSTQLSISLSLAISIPINTNPPAIYVSQTQSKVYTQYLFGVISALHLLLIAFTIFFLFRRLKVMLLIIDAFNSLTILYILTALGLYNISLLSYQSSRGLQPFIYQFGSALTDETTNFYYLNYTSNFFSSTIIQSILIVAIFLISAVSRKNQSQQHIWHYYRTAFMFVFSYDFLLACFSTFFWNTYNSYESSYSWMFAILTLMFIFSQTIVYYGRVKDYGGEGKKVVPAISFITNDMEARDSTKQNINMFEMESQNKDKKQLKGVLSQWSDEKTEVILAEGNSKEAEQAIAYFDITPSVETQYSSKSRNNISPLHLPVLSVLFGLFYTIICNIQTTKIRSSLYVVTSILYLFFVVISRNETIKSLRNIKLLILSLLYIVLSIFSLVLSFNSQTLDLVKFDTAIVAFVIFAMLFNGITFVVSVFKSEAYRDYLINKKNEEILERTKKQNEARQKIYTKNDFNNSKTKKGKIESISQQPESFQVKLPQNEIQPTQEHVEQKQFKLSDLKKRPRDDRTMMHQRQSSSIINHQIDDEISDLRESDMRQYNNSEFLNEKNIFDIKHSIGDPISPKKIKGSRVQAITNSQMSVISRKGQTPSMFFDSSLQKIDELKGVKRNVNKSKQKQEVVSKKRAKRRKSPNVQTDIIGNQQQYYSKEIEVNPKSKLKKYKQQEKRQSVEDILEELDMPKGFKKSEDSNFRARILSIDEISSIKEQRQQFVDQQGASQYEGSVFNKILNDYKKYRHKKIDRKKLKEIKGKNVEPN